ncbi:MAG: hypothetical protein JXB46_02490 [Candidatus Eisenbacteria bacterium]|nr:hypothetical protein [Candidatus Eisenbacteria bacterium]
MRRGFLITMGAVVIVAVVVFVWWLPAYREAELQRQLAAIESMEDLTARKEAALDFLVENRMADRELLLRALDAAADEFRDSENRGPLVALYESLYLEDLTPWLRYRVIARLDRALMEMDTPESVARAEGLAQEMLDATDAPMETYHWMVYFHQRSDLANPELTLRLAVAAKNATDRDEYGMWPQILNMAYSKLLNTVNEQQGLAAALSQAEQLRIQTDDPPALAALNAAVYHIAVGQDDAAAVAAARAIDGLNGLTSSDPLNSIAYDMAERGLAPDLAVGLSKRALALASSRYDSTMILDTVGWAYYANGEYAEAAGYLQDAVGMMDETLTSDNETVQHLLAAYEAGSMRDEAIALLAKVVARSVLADDPARGQLAALLTKRDGNAAGMDKLVTDLRYADVQMAPDFELPDTAGNVVTLEGLRGNVVALCFWSYG